MSNALNEQLLDAVSAIGPTSWSGRCFRYTTARRDPLSGEGARLHGGRWNPPDLFPAIYLADPRSACLRELAKAASDNHLEVQAQLRVPYKLHTIRVDQILVLDLRERHTQVGLGLEADQAETWTWEECQPIGHAAWFLEFAGVLAPAATGSGLTLALFEHRIGPDQVQVETSDPLTFDLFGTLG